MKTIIQNITKVMNTTFPTKTEVLEALELKARSDHTHSQYSTTTVYTEIQNNFANKLKEINNE